MSDVAYPRVQAHLARLKLPRMAECLDNVAQEAAKHDWTYVEFLDQLLDAEVSARYERDVAMKTKLAHFPFVKTLDQFDFAFQPAISERQVRELATLSFIVNTGLRVSELCDLQIRDYDKKNGQLLVRRGKGD